MGSSRVRKDAVALSKSEGIPYQVARKIITSPKPPTSETVSSSYYPLTGGVLELIEIIRELTGSGAQVYSADENAVNVCADLDHRGSALRQPELVTRVPGNRSTEAVVRALRDETESRRAHDAASRPLVVIAPESSFERHHVSVLKDARDVGVYVVSPSLINTEQAEEYLRDKGVMSPFNAWMSAAGVTDIKAYDPSTLWAQSSGEFLVGQSVDTDQGITDRFLRLSFDGGGDDVLSVIQGSVSGERDSALISAVLSSAMDRNPQDLNFFIISGQHSRSVLALNNLPHVRGVVSELDKHPEDLSRAVEAVVGEITSRREALNVSGSSSYRNYRGDYPMPELVLVLHDMNDLFTHNKHILGRLYGTGDWSDIGVRVLCVTDQFSEELVPRPAQTGVGFSVSFHCADYVSRGLLGVPDAALLSKGTGRALVKFQDALGREGITQVQGFDPLRESVNESSALEFVVASLEGFESAPPMLAPSLRDPLVLDAEILRKRGGITPVDAWVGESDQPNEHVRKPMTVPLNENIAIHGYERSGKSTALMSMVASTAVTHADNVRWMIVDPREGCDAVKDYPNVIAYSKPGDSDTLLRILGEAEMLVESRASTGTSDKSTVIVAIDDLDMLLESQGDDNELKVRLRNLASSGTDNGVSIIVTSRGALPVGAAKYFANPVALRGADTSFLTDLNGISRGLVREIPDVAGYGVDTRVNTYFRIGAPFEENIAKDVHEQIVEFGKKLPARSTPRIKSIPTELRASDLQDLMEDVHGDDAEALLPLGVHVDTAKPLFMDPRVSRSLVVAGSSSTDTTDTLRALVAHITAYRDPSDTRLVVIDPGLLMIKDRDELIARGFLNPENYASSTADIQRVTGIVKGLSVQRIPQDGKLPKVNLFKRAAESPEVFIIVPGLQQLAHTELGEFKNMIRAMDGWGRLDIGVRFLMSSTSKDADSILTRSGAWGINPHVLTLSGHASDTRVTSKRVRFKSRPKGRGVYISSYGEAMDVQVAQESEN